MKRFRIIVKRSVFESCVVEAESKELATEIYQSGQSGTGEPWSGEWSLDDYADDDELLGVEEV